MISNVEFNKLEQNFFSGVVEIENNGGIPWSCTNEFLSFLRAVLRRSKYLIIQRRMLE
jgi:hypothetical protein